MLFSYDMCFAVCHTHIYIYTIMLHVYYHIFTHFAAFVDDVFLFWQKIRIILAKH